MRLTALLAALTLAGCASIDTGGGPAGLPGLPGSPGTTPGGITDSTPPRPPTWPELDEATRRQRLARLLPATLRDRQAWANDLHAAFVHLQIPHEPSIYCSVLAIIEQESGYQANPAVPGLGKIAWKELQERAGRYGIPSLLLEAAMLKSSADGRSYRQRIDALKTEKEMSDLYEEMIAEIPFGKRLLADFNPVRTGGPMQVSVDFAERQARERGYPYPVGRNIREEIFTRRGGLYFGVAILLDYPAPYDDVVYRFADFNAGRYSSRNAAFQAAVAQLSRRALARDGDLLRYRKGQALPEASSVETALRSLNGRLRLSDNEIRRDLLLEKSAEFGDSVLFKRVFALADQATGKRLPRQTMPEIDLKSPKITRKLTTEWFARRVEGRFKSCLGRVDATAA